MNENRIKKFERLLKFQTKRLDVLKQQLAVQRNLSDTLRQEYEQLVIQKSNIEKTQVIRSNDLAMLQQTDRAIVDLQRKINAKKGEVSSADERLDFLIHSFREQDRLCRSWEKLIERKAAESRMRAVKLEMQQADDLFLMSQRLGDSR